MHHELPLWTPHIDGVGTPVYQFAQLASLLAQRPLESFQDLHTWSVTDVAGFWKLVWEFCDVKGDQGDPSFCPEPDMMQARFFPNAKLNFAENLLKTTGSHGAIVFWGEDKVKVRWSWDQ